MSKHTLLLIIILFLLTLGLLIVALKKSFYNNTNVDQSSVPTIAIKNPFLPDTSLLFGNPNVAYPMELGSKKSPVHSLPILINTGINNVTAVQLELSFDPNVLTNISITPSTFFKNPNVIINKINTDTGKIYYALAEFDSALTASNAAAANTASESAKQGEGTLAVITFESSVSSASSTITFLPRTFVTAEGLESSALKSTNSAKFLIQPKLGN